MVQIYSLMSYHPTLHFTPWSLDLFVRVCWVYIYICFHSTYREHIVLYSFRRLELIVHNTHCYIGPTRYTFSPESSEAFEGEVLRPKDTHRNTVPKLRGEKHDISLKNSAPTGLENARLAAISAKRHALTIAPYPSPNCTMNNTAQLSLAM